MSKETLMRDKQKGKHWNNTKEITGKIELANKLEQYLETLCLYQWGKASKQASKKQASNTEILDKVVKKIKKQQETDRAHREKREDEHYWEPETFQWWRKKVYFMIINRK